MHAVNIPSRSGRRLFGWMALPLTAAHPLVPAALMMHSWGANAESMWPSVAPLHAAGFMALLIDAHCHGRSDDETFTSMPTLRRTSPRALPGCAFSPISMATGCRRSGSRSAPQPRSFAHCTTTMCGP